MRPTSIVSTIATTIDDYAIIARGAGGDRRVAVAARSRLATGRFDTAVSTAFATAVATAIDGSALEGIVGGAIADRTAGAAGSGATCIAAISGVTVITARAAGMSFGTTIVVATGTSV